MHISTDCVFSGNRGNYCEDDIPDPTDLYGRSKLLGEVAGPGALTLRTSVIGHELSPHLGLVDWFRSQKNGRVDGFARALYTGLTAQALAEVVAMLVASQSRIEGVWHVSSDAISKYDLLLLINKYCDLAITVEKDEKFVCDRRLDSSRFRAGMQWRPPSWDEMIKGLCGEEGMYARRNRH
jgi:dTDP-4-dehydrorhamnose reductase